MYIEVLTRSDFLKSKVVWIYIVMPEWPLMKQSEK